MSDVASPIDDVVSRVLASTRYRDVDRAFVERLAAEEIERARGSDDAVKRVKRRLHQAVGAYRGGRSRDVANELRATWRGAWDEAMHHACLRALERHASTRERIGELETFYPRLWEAAGAVPASVLDLACGLNPLALPFMGMRHDATYLACDADERVLGEVEAFLALVGQPHRTWACDLVSGPPSDVADVALLLKTVPLLDHQEPGAAARVLSGLRARHVVVSFPARSLGGRGGLGASSPARMRELIQDVGAPADVTAELRFRSELVYVVRTGVTDG